MGVTLRLDPAAVLAERDEWVAASRVAAAELIDEARRKAESERGR